MNINKIRLTALLLFLLSCTSSESESPKETPQTELKTQRIDYQVYDQWTIPNGGYGKVILIDPTRRNENDLRLLGETLKFDTRNDRNAFVFVYDDIKAAEMRDNLSNLNKKDEKFYDKHFIANYTRNINSGYHQLDIMVNGIDGERVNVKY